MRGRSEVNEAFRVSRAEVLVQSLLVVLQTLSHLGNDAFVDVITEVCTLVGVSVLSFIFSPRHLIRFIGRG